jgi:hypothetical protein
LQYGPHAGAVREIQAGAGYWSQNSNLPVLAKTATPTGLRVRWPGGRTNTYPLPENALEVQVAMESTITVLR